MAQSQVQLGKNKVTPDFIKTLSGHFKNHENVKVSVLKNATRDKAEMQKIVEQILDGLGKNYTARTLGFTIFVKRWRKDKR